MTESPSVYHLPVLLHPAVDLLVTRPDGVYVDGTLGGGGHAAAILERLDAHGRLLGCDQDAEAVERARLRFASDDRMTVIHGSTVHLNDYLTSRRIRVIDGVLLDLGMSSRHLDAPERGFSFRQDGPLDMRMDTRQTLTARQLLDHATVDELARLLSDYGEERHARRIARAILDARDADGLHGTRALAAAVEAAADPRHVSATLARVFQAIRIAVNGELDALDRMLHDGIDRLAAGGRIVVISYHSLEDRRVKQRFRDEARTCICPPRIPVCVCGTRPRVRILTSKPLEPDPDEILANPRSRSARLRAAERCADA